ncbi:DUF2147 domain-containing protein [Sphingomonas sp. 28-63-12]|uniref:DUF2147 domain-containing protein n=1 Tax=Sphingomonas sp. 28-63-12 TaxID=1970434 RepID=UPI000BDC3ECC|nr:MAG: hypothetical protein B7Y47_11170 [Sphingomonas sp. 28-63-12]
MYKLPKYFLILATLASSATAASAAATPVVPGQVWALDDARGPIVKFTDCDGKLCASLVALGPDEVSPRDIRNPNPALRNRVVCGLNIITGLTRSSKGLIGGTIYDPQTGQSHPMRIDDRTARPKILIPFGPFSASMAMLAPAGAMGKCPA